MAAYTLWGTLSNFYYTTGGAIGDADWAPGNVTDGGDPIWTDDETSAAGLVQGDPATYNIYLTSQDWLASQQPAVSVASTTMVNPFGANGNLSADTIFSSSDTTGSGAVIWWQASATAGNYDLEFEKFTTNYVAAPSTTPNTILSGNVVSLKTAISNPTNWSWDSSGTNFAFGYSTAASQSTENIYLQAFDTSGQAISPLVEAATDVSDSTQWYIGYNAINKSYNFHYTVVNGAQTGFYDEIFNPSTGALSALTFQVPQTYSQYFGTGVKDLSNGGLLVFTEGMDNGLHVLQATRLNSSNVVQGVTQTYDLSGSTGEHWQIQSVFDPNDGYDDYTALAYTDAGQVHLELLNASGVQIGSDFIVPNITSFDRIYVMDNQRIEISYTVPDANGGQDVLGSIYSTVTFPYVYPLYGSGEYVGTPFNDTLTDGPGANWVNGGGGTDTFVVNYSAAQVSVSIDGSGNADLLTPDSTDVLERFTTIQLLDATITLYTNVANQPYSAYDTITSGGVLDGVDYFFTNVSAQAYSSYEYLYNGGNDFIGSKFFYTDISGQAYTAAEYDYDGGGNLTRIDFTGVSGTAYSSYEYDYVSDIYSGAKFEFTNVPTGANYASYETDYNAADQFIGDKFYFANITGQAYTGEELDFDGSGNLARVLLTGVTGQAYSSLELDYVAGTYAGYKAFYAISGESYTGLEVDVSTTNQITKAVYTGLTSTPYSSVEEDFSSGALTSTTYDFTNQTGQNFSAYQVIDDASGNALQEIVDNNDGSHTIVGYQNNETFSSIGNDTFTGGGSGETFVFNPAYGHDTITDFSTHLSGSGHDTMSASTSEFASFATLLADTQNVGNNAVITAQNGDTITLDNMSASTLAANQADFTFHA